MTRPRSAIVAAALAAVLAQPAAADPMRPLAGVGTAGGSGAASAPAAAAAGVDAPAARGAARGAAPADAPPPSPLQAAERLVAIRHDPGRGFKALVGERWLVAGDRLGNMTISSIDANGLQTADGRGRRVQHRLLPTLLQGAPPPPPAAPLTTPR